MKNAYRIYWIDGDEFKCRTDKYCTLEELRKYIKDVKFHYRYTVESVELIIELKMRIDIDGEV